MKIYLDENLSKHIAEALNLLSKVQVGFTESDMAKVGGGNFCRVFDTATKGK